VHDTPSKAGSPVQLRRVLGLPALIIYGLVLIQPTAPMPLYGVASDKAHGHVVTLILMGMVAMMFTALSYGRMANAYPSAGSAYTYVGRELHPAFGYLTGWSMMFDYVMNPIICVIWCGKATVDLIQALSAMQLLPQIGPADGALAGLILTPQAWFVAYAALFTLLNLRGIQASTRTNYVLAGGLSLVIVVFFVMALRHLIQQPPAGAAAFTRPFYDPATFAWGSLSNGAALAVLTYIGFDGISTLSEEVHNPRRNVLLATVLVCFIIGVLSAAEVYVAQLVWPEPASTFTPPLENAFAQVARRAGGPVLFVIVTAALLVASVGSGMGAHLGAGRLLYGMGRDDAIPKGFFGRLNPRTRIPSNNIMLVGIVALVGAFGLDYKQEGYDLGAQLLNFGALVGFMGVNMAALVHYYVRGTARRWHHLVPHALGFVICLYLWYNLSPIALAIGFAWLAVGVLYGAWRTSFYRRPLRMFTGEDPGRSEPSAL
jgi:amino acid transporter